MFPNNFGWHSALEEIKQQSTFDGHHLGRITRVDRGLVQVATEAGILRGTPVGRLLAEEAIRSPAVGDWVTWVPMSDNDVVVLDILPRLNQLQRVAAGNTSRAQVLATNVDLAFIAMAANRDFNLSRLERYLMMVSHTGIQPRILLTRCDTHDDTLSLLGEVASIAPDIPVLETSAVTGMGFDTLESWLQTGTTAVILGSSGVGKSTLINRLLSEQVQATGHERASDGRGRHTTTSRNLIQLPQGGIIIDTPGLREILPLVSEEALQGTFPDIEALSEMCRFRDCIHEDEPGCAVLEAVASGELPERRLGNYHKLQRETAQARLRDKTRKNWESRREGKKFGRMVKEAKRIKRMSRS